jgi:hypothetical protein
VGRRPQHGAGLAVSLRRCAQPGRPRARLCRFRGPQELFLSPGIHAAWRTSRSVSPCRSFFRPRTSPHSVGRRYCTTSARWRRPRLCSINRRRAWLSRMGDRTPASLLLPTNPGASARLRRRQRAGGIAPRASRRRRLPAAVCVAEQILLGARVLALADAFDELTQDAPDRSAFAPVPPWKPSHAKPAPASTAWL